MIMDSLALRRLFLAAAMALGSVSILCEVGWWAGHSSRQDQRPALKVLYQVLALLVTRYTLLLSSVLFLPLSVIHRCYGRKFAFNWFIINLMGGFEVLP